MELPVSSRRYSTLLASAIAIAGAYVLFAFAPETHAFYPRCAFKVLTGFDCPGCGTTRALHHLLHGELGAAFRLNPMLFAFIGVFGISVPSLARGERPRFIDRPWFGWTCFAAIVAWWIGRNVT